MFAIYKRELRSFFHGMMGYASAPVPDMVMFPVSST